MADDPEDDLDPYIRRLFPSDVPARKPVTRGADRRQNDRRQLGFRACRTDDADLNQRRRTLILWYLRQLPTERLWEWIDGLWLGCATDAQLDALGKAVEDSGPPRLPLGPLPKGRPRVEQIIPGEHPLATRFEWHVLTEWFKAFGRARQQHHARMNRTRGGAPRSLEHREGCLASSLGQRVDQAGLFAEFFDAPRRLDLPHLIPTEMAARLLHYESHARLVAFETTARAEAKKARSNQRRRVWNAQAAKAAVLLKHFPTWKTLYRKLKQTR